MPTIVVVGPRGATLNGQYVDNAYEARLNGDPTLWEIGRSEAEAIGKLVITHRLAEVISSQS